MVDPESSVDAHVRLISSGQMPSSSLWDDGALCIRAREYCMIIVNYQLYTPGAWVSLAIGAAVDLLLAVCVDEHAFVNMI